MFGTRWLRVPFSPGRQEAGTGADRGTETNSAAAVRAATVVVPAGAPNKLSRFL